MLLASDISKAIEEAFRADPTFNEYVIERSEYVNENPSLCPWMGIYRGGIDYSPETLGDGPDYWTGSMVMRLIVQASDYNSGADAEDKLETQVRDVINKMFTDKTIRGSVDIINSVQVSYSYVAEDEATMFFQAAIIELTLEVSTA
jgi:hypothetical protein